MSAMPWTPQPLGQADQFMRTFAFSMATSELKKCAISMASGLLGMTPKLQVCVPAQAIISAK